ncbi:hypothetical protein VPH35_048733 [Triticum aestivum]|uniref:F-box protein AT5G49610-like beta-propeller domain-containing protein n=3 Tax=Triticum aestivum TaxID=4565 RepID=A0A077RTS5_WHEAT|nr:uncharacterized protein LOC123175172 [Triticum aestivum]CDM80341.1 unnamed protein product [Triticum aestivum]
MAGRRRSRSRIQGDGAARPSRRRSRVHGSENGDGATRPSRRRSRVISSEDGDGVTRPSRRRSRVVASEDGDGATRPSRRRSRVVGSEDGDGATRPSRRRSRVVGSEDGDGVTRPSRRRSRVVGSDDGDGATRPSRRRRASSPEVPDEADADTLWESLPLDMIWEILLLLPPERPSLVLPPKRRSFLRASGVSTLWRGVATDPNFMSQHRRKWKPPLLGVFERRQQKFHFTPVLHPPDGIPADRIHISSQMTSRDCDATGCRHGRVLAIHRLLPRLVVFAPLTGQEHCLAFPDEFRECNYHHGAVLCAASGPEDHVHGFCHESPFKVAFLSRYPTRYRFITSVYSSESGTWGGLKEIEAPFKVALVDVPATLVGNVLYWMLSSNDVCAAMLEFDLDTQSLAVIKGPSDMNYSGSHRIIKIEQGTVGWVRFSFPSLEIWLRQKNCHGVATWLQHKTVDMHDILGIPPRASNNRWHQKILSYDEDNNVIILYVDDSAYMLDLKSMESTKLDESRLMNRCHPFASFYPPDMTI